MTSLPEPQFIDRDPEVIRGEIIARVEQLLGESLPPLSTERILCEQLAYRETLTRIAIQQACLQNLWQYAQYPMIDHLAALVGESRRPAQYATTTLVATLPAPRGVVSVIPRDSVVRTTDGKVAFVVDEDIAIPIGQTTGTSGATASVTGVVGNGYVAGQVSELATSPGFEVTIQNTTTTANGAPSETSDEMRLRVPLMLTMVSGAGPGDAYESLALDASAEVADALATRPTDGTVRVTVLADTGVPSGGLLATVLAALSQQTKVPLTDTIETAAAVAVDVDLILSVTLYYPQSPRTTEMALDDVEAAVTDWFINGRSRKLGRQVPSAGITKAAQTVPEVWDVAIVGELPDVDEGEFANLASITVNLAGYTTEPLP